jgi:hypothetical protein
MGLPEWHHKAPLALLRVPMVDDLRAANRTIRRPSAPSYLAGRVP